MVHCPICTNESYMHLSLMEQRALPWCFTAHNVPWFFRVKQSALCCWHCLLKKKEENRLVCVILFCNFEANISISPWFLPLILNSRSNQIPCFRVADFYLNQLAGCQYITPNVYFCANRRCSSSIYLAAQGEGFRFLPAFVFMFLLSFFNCLWLFYSCFLQLVEQLQGQVIMVVSELRLLLLLLVLSPPPLVRLC